MKKEYDFSKMKAVKNPYAKILKKQITIRLNSTAIEYFKNMAEEMGIPYQVLIDSYLTDCAVSKRRLNLKWRCLILKKVVTVQKGRCSANGDKTGRKNRPGP